MTGKQQRFCDEYLIDCNATRAAIAAGYSKQTAYSQGQRLLKNVETKNYIAHQQEERSKRSLLTFEERQRILAEIAKDPNSNKSDRIKALDVYNKMTGAYIERVQMSATVTEQTKLDKIIADLEEDEAAQDEEGDEA